MNNLLKTLIFLLVVQTGYLFSQEPNASFVMAGYSADIDIYNFRVITSDNGSLTGGFLVLGEDLDPDEDYRVEVEFGDGGFYRVGGEGSDGGNEAANGETGSNGKITPTSSGTCQINFSHESLVATDGYPGSVDGVTMKIRLREGTNYAPDENGESFSFDLVRPTIQSVTIVSNNYIGVTENFDWATTNNTTSFILELLLAY